MRARCSSSRADATSLFEVLGAFALILAGAFASIWAVVYAYYRLNRRRVRKSARLAAAALGLTAKEPGDSRFDLYAGASMGCRLFVAAHAAVKPGPAFEFERNPVVAILALFPEPVPGLLLTTTHLAPHTMRTGDSGFDQWFKVQSQDVALAGRILEPAVRDALMGVYPGREPAGSGMIIDVDAERVLVRWHEARPRHADAVARAVLAAALKLGQRAAFLR
jgi:hypothetical protein